MDDSVDHVENRLDSPHQAALRLNTRRGDKHCRGRPRKRQRKHLPLRFGLHHKPGKDYEEQERHVTSSITRDAYLPASAKAALTSPESSSARGCTSAKPCGNFCPSSR